MQALEHEISNADLALNELKEGNLRFRSNLRRNRDYAREIEATKDGQKPYAVIISCMDSRVSGELVFDQGIGEVFSIRLAGNVVTPEVVASCEFATHVVGASLIVVLGHTRCGAIKGAIDGVKLGQLHTILERIKKNVTMDLDDPNCNAICVEENVKAGIASLKDESEILKKLYKNKKINIVGGVYDVTTGHVEFFE